VNDFQEEMCRLRFLKIFLDVRMGYRIILLILILWFAHKKLVTPWKIRYVSDNVWEQKHFFDESSYIAKGVLTPEFCNKLIDTSRNLTYSKSNEPVDKEPLYQIDIFHGTKVIHEKLWDICKDIYYKHRVNHSNTDFMFLKRYLPEERVRIPLHFDTCKYTISFLLSDTDSFQGCQYYMFDKNTSAIVKEISKCEIKVRDDFIENYNNLPIINFQQGDMVKFDAKTHYHGTLPLTGGERYLLTIFYDKPS